MKAISKARRQTGAGEGSQIRLDAASKGTIAVMGGISALVGLWALACLVSAMLGSGGLLALTRGWFLAVTGM